MRESGRGGGKNEPYTTRAGTLNVCMELLLEVLGEGGAKVGWVEEDRFG
jgi:hypothetical protein